MNHTILALDTATEACSVALLHQGNITFEDELSPRTHTQLILPMIDGLLKNAHLSIKELDYLVFGRGPGSFTGVRVGVGVAQGLAFGAELKVVPISNLTTMAEQAYQELGATEVIALIDARMNEVYFSQVKEQVCSPECALEQFQLDDEKITVVGTGWVAYPQFAEQNLPLVISEITLPSAKYMLALAEQEIEKGNVKSVDEIEPVYLRNEVTWKKLPHKQ